MKYLVGKLVVFIIIAQIFLPPFFIFAEMTEKPDSLVDIDEKSGLEENNINSDKDHKSFGFYTIDSLIVTNPNQENESSKDEEIISEVMNEKEEVKAIESNEENSNKELITEIEEVKMEIAAKIENLTFDELLNEYGGRSVITNAFVDKDLHVIPSEDNADLDVYHLDSTFDALKENRTKFIDDIVLNFSEYNTLQPEELYMRLSENINQLMIVKIYLDRWYDVEIAENKLSEQLYFKEKSASDILDIAVKFKKNPELMNSRYTGQTYRKELAEYFQFKTVKELIEFHVKEQVGTINYNEWFKSYFKGSILESTASIKELDISTWDKVCDNLNNEQSTTLEPKSGSDNHILPILTMENPENMIIGNAQGLLIYSSKNNFKDYQKSILTTLNNFSYHLETMINTQHSEAEKERIISELRTLPVFDAELNDEGQFDYFKTANSLSNGFYTAIQHLVPLKFNAGAANATANYQGITFVEATVDWNDAGTLAHEYSHSTVPIFMDSKKTSNWGYRNSKHIEVVASRIDNSWFEDEGVLFNISNKKATVEAGLSNSSGRFEEAQDLQDYFGGVMGLVYGLNVVISDVILSLPVEEQVGYIRKWDKNTNKIKTLTKSEIENLNLKSIHDLIYSDIGIFDKSIPDGETPTNYGYGSSYYSLDSHFFIPENGEYSNEYPYMVQMVDELLSLQTYSGWEAVNLFFSNNVGASSNLDALQLIFKDQSFNFKDFRELQLTTYGTKVKKYGLLEDSYDMLVADISNNLGDLRQVKESFYEKYNLLTDEFRSSIFAGEILHSIQAPIINPLSNFSNEISATSPKLENGMTYELVILVNGYERERVSIKSEEVFSNEMEFKGNDIVTAYILGKDEDGITFKGEEAQVTVEEIVVEGLVIPPLYPENPENISPIPENPDLGEGLSILYASKIRFPITKVSKNLQTVPAIIENEDKSSSKMIAIANFKEGNKRKRAWNLQVVQERAFSNGARITLSPFVSEKYKNQYGMTVNNETIYLNNENSVVASADGSGEPGIVPVGMGEVNLEVPGGIGIGKTSSLIRWILVSEPGDF